MRANERFKAVARGKEFDRLPIIEWACWWDKTVSRWYNEGLPNSADDDIKIQQHFGLDILLQHGFKAFTNKTPHPKYHGAGIIENEADYERILPTLYPEPALPENYLHHAKKYRNSKEGCILWYTISGYFWFPRDLFGIERHLMSFYDYPELYHRICEDMTNWNKRVVEYCKNSFDFDFMTFGEDLSYNHGSMLSKEMFDEFMAPYYKKLVPLIKESDCITVVDSDGDITKPVEWFDEVGVEGVLPLERQAGVDVCEYIDKFPEMLYIGHYDKMVMDKGEQAVINEFERLLPSAKRGRFMISVDHQTPPAVSYSEYQIFLKHFREYAKKAAQK